MFDSSYSFKFKGVFKDSFKKKILNVAVYIFKTPEKHKYVIRFEEFFSECFHVCFYKHSHKKHPKKYELNASDGSPYTKIRTVLESLKKHLKYNYCASYIIIGALKPSEKVKNKETCKFRIYRYLIKHLISSEYFYHYEAKQYNAYFLINKQYINLENIDKDEYIKKIEALLKEKAPIIN